MALLRNISGISPATKSLEPDYGSDGGGNMPGAGYPDAVPNSPQPNPVPVSIKPAVENETPAPVNVAIVTAESATQKKVGTIGLIGLGASYVAALYPHKGVTGKEQIRRGVFVAGLLALYYGLNELDKAASNYQQPLPAEKGYPPDSGTVEPGGNGGGTDSESPLPSVPDPNLGKQKVCVLPGFCIYV